MKKIFSILAVLILLVAFYPSKVEANNSPNTFISDDSNDSNDNLNKVLPRACRGATREEYDEDGNRCRIKTTRRRCGNAC